eukprot:TRINITY_DN13705_c0_g2_i1.p1 TRINITY_DN13705_c0_g2~~TRINITY_DN13705_c0_g2_i1.p1  ORF type:complete len:177 (+),score=41.50 TRINITY_DN13705_c0_g2_i1:47-577(+)
MGSVFEFTQRIFPPGLMKPGMTKEEFGKLFERRLREFEEGGFLEETKLPPIRGEEEFLRKLAYHKRNDELMVVKYWKKGCMPCLSKAEMYKEVEQWMNEDRPGAAFYSIDIHHKDNLDLSERQLVDGTPSIQKYWNCQQVGGEVRVNEKQSFMENIKATIASCMAGKCPTNTEPEM